MTHLQRAGWLATGVLALGACSLRVDAPEACSADGTCDTGFACNQQGFCVPEMTGPAATGCTRAVTAGDEHSCAIRSDGTAWCWGRNDNGQLGDNTTLDRLEPIAVTATGMPSLTAIVGGSNHTCALGDNGTVWCWGHNGDGQLGNNSTVDKQTPVQVDRITGATAIAAGDNHTCALDGDQRVMCWGLNDAGQLGVGSMERAIGTPQAVALPGAVTAVAVSARGATTCAIGGTADHELFCWGDNGSGQLGNGRMGNVSRSPVTTRQTAITAVAVGGSFVCAVAESGAVRCAGDNGAAQLANGHFGGSSSSFAPAGLTVPAKAIAAGARFACAIDDQRRVWCWGDNSNGEYADGSFDTRVVPMRTGYSDAVQLAAGGGHVCVVSSAGDVSCSGSNKRGQLGDSHRTTQSTPHEIAGLSGVLQVVGGSGHTCALLADHTVRCWGVNWAGQLGDGTQTWRATPAAVEGVSNVTQLASGFDHVCALRGDHTVACWGHNDEGQLGNGTPDDHADHTVATTVVGLGDVTQIAAGGNQTCAIAGGAVRCWGHLQDGSGIPVAMTLPSPVPIAIAVGRDHACAVSENHTAACWGNNDNGELGIGDKDSQSMPMAVMGLPEVDAIVAGDRFSCARTTSGGAWCWGYGWDGQLATGAYGQESLPKLSKVTGAATLAAGGGHVCGVTSDRTLACWGASYEGQLGTGLYGSISMPAIVPGLTVSAAGLGGAHTCVVTAPDGHVACWGDGRGGQLGDGVITPMAPVRPHLQCP